MIVEISFGKSIYRHTSTDVSAGCGKQGCLRFASGSAIWLSPTYTRFAAYSGPLFEAAATGFRLRFALAVRYATRAHMRGTVGLLPFLEPLACCCRCAARRPSYRRTRRPLSNAALIWQHMELVSSLFLCRRL